MGGKRYDTEPKLNMKKVLGVIVGIAVIIMFVVTLTKLLKDSANAPKISGSAKQYFSVYTQDKWGVIDNQGNIVIEPTYDEMILIPNNNNPIFLCTYEVDYTNNTYKTKVINEKSQEILKGYDLIEAIPNFNVQGETWYENNVFKVSKDGKYGMIDIKGKELLACNYDEIKALESAKDYIEVIKDGKSGIYDIYGNAITDIEYKEVKVLNQENKKEFIIKNEEDKYGIVSLDKSVVLEPLYDEISTVSNGNLYVVKENEKLAIINIDKSINITEIFDEVKEINDSNIVITKDSKYGIIGIDGEEKITAQYDSLKYAFGKNYIAKKDNKYGIINIEDGTKLEFDYSSLSYRKGADIIVGKKEGNESELYNSNFELKLTGIISDLDIDKGYMKVRQDGEYKYYNFKFEEKKNAEILLKNTLFLDKKDGKYGYINNRGEVVVDYQYDDATEQNEFGFASVNKDGKWGCIDKSGNIVVEPQRDLKNNQIISFIGKWNLGVDAQANYYTDL